MSEPFVAEIRILGFNFAPRGWATCDGQLLPISQNTALFALLGTTFGGDGRTNFALPNMQGAIPVCAGQGSGLSDYVPGQSGGIPNVTLNSNDMPAHRHTLSASLEAGDNQVPNPNLSLAASVGATIYVPGSSPVVQMAPQALPPAGGSYPHNNLMPYLTLNFCIAMQGIFPPRG